ncbi:MAG: DUF4910 domain-containing protein [Bacteroidales bacterium]
MDTYRKEHIIKTLRKVGIKKGDNIFIHSDIGLFGLLEDAKKRTDYYTIFKSAFFDIIGNDGTMINPTFSYSFCKKNDFDIYNTKSTVGLFSEFAQQDEDAIRSEDANFSIVAIGKNAKYFTEGTPDYSFGENSFWQKFLSKNGKFVFLNLSLKVFTFIHYAEKQLHVPYRYDKTFKGEIITKGGDRIKRNFYHYVFDHNKPLNGLCTNKLQKLAMQQELLRHAKLGRGEISMITAEDSFALIKEEIEKDPAFLIKGDNVQYEMKNDLNEYFDRLFPICRSLTGNGNRKTLEILSEIVDLKITEIPSGTECFDWTIPPEWNIKEAWVKDSKGNKIVDFASNNLHILGYSEPFHNKLSFDELKPHLYSLPEQPELIPYLTSYYKQRWGFCLSHNQLLSLDENETYEVYIDSSLDHSGSMTIGEAIIKGESDEEVLFSTYICHPSLANNELSGPLVSAFIYKELKKRKNLKYTYRFLFIPETIGSIYSLSVKGEYWKKKLKAGYVLTCIGDNGNFTYKRSRLGDTLADRAAEIILEQSEDDYNLIDFFPSGSDERQYCSPGFNLPVGSLMRTMYSKYPEYHTSGDNKEFISFEAMEHSVNKYIDIIEAIEKNHVYINKFPNCEPQLGKRGLYPTLGSQKDTEDFVNAMMWILNLADGNNDLISISKRSKIPLKKLYPIIDKLIEKGILTKEKEGYMY